MACLLSKLSNAPALPSSVIALARQCQGVDRLEGTWRSGTRYRQMAGADSRFASGLQTGATEATLAIAVAAEQGARRT